MHVKIAKVVMSIITTCKNHEEWDHNIRITEMMYRNVAMEHGYSIRLL